MYLPNIYRGLLLYFVGINDQEQYGRILWNNKDFVIGGHSLLIQEWKIEKV